MGDAKPYVFTDANGNFTGFDAELFRDVARRLGFKEDQVIFTGQELSALLPSVANGRFDVAVAAIGTTEAASRPLTLAMAILPATFRSFPPDPALNSNESTAGKRIGVDSRNTAGNLCREEPERATSSNSLTTIPRWPR